MNKKYRFIILFICLTSSFLKPHAITYKLNGGRLGDCIYSFSLARWLAYKYNTQFYYIPFGNIDLFSIESHEKILAPNIKKKFKKIITVKSEDELSSYLKSQKEPTLFLIYFHAKFIVPEDISSTDPLAIRKVGTNWIYLLMKQNKNFEKTIKRDLHIRKNPKPLILPNNMITVAVHIRKGGGFDAPLGSAQYVSKHKHFKIPSDRVHPLKFPPEQYYVDQIINISDMFNNFPIFICIFTDDQDPDGLTKRLKQKIDRPNIEFACAQTGHNIFTENILDDVYQMSRFDCLIKSSSHFAWISQLIGDHKIIIYPQLATWDSTNNIIKIIKTGIFFNESDNRKITYMQFTTLDDEHRQKAKKVFNHIFQDNFKNGNFCQTSYNVI